jgi:hypothetical protein
LRFPTADDDPSPVVLGAPTGLAAFNIGGQTLHRLLGLIVQHDKFGRYRKLTNEKKKIFRATLGRFKLFIIDEISMVSNIVFNMLNLRLNEIFADTVQGELKQILNNNFKFRCYIWWIKFNFIRRFTAIKTGWGKICI